MTRVPTLTNAIQHNIGCSSQSNQERKINERHPNKKGRSKIISIVRTLESTKKLLELINEFFKIGGYKINIQKSGVLFYTNNKLWRSYFTQTFILQYKNNRNADNFFKH